MKWLISANCSIYDCATSFEDYKFIDWRQGNIKYEVGDTVYIYCIRPVKKIRFKCIVKKKDIPLKYIRDDKEYWNNDVEYKKSLKGKFIRLNLIDKIDTEKLNLENLLNNGLKVAPQGPKKLSGELLEYIEKNFNDSNQSDTFPEMIDKDVSVFEGLKKEITVNKYERSSYARAKCIEYNGTKCKICGMNFEEKYGKIGVGFIHVHHIKPIHEIGKEYKIDYKNDLIPVCPNCHAMLHRKINGKELTVEQLKSIVEERAKDRK